VEQKEAEDKHLPVIECIRSEGSSQNVKKPASSIAALTEKIVEQTRYRVHGEVFPNTRYLSVRSWSVMKVTHPFVAQIRLTFRATWRRDDQRQKTEGFF
jgi:hypothetical protein